MSNKIKDKNLQALQNMYEAAVCAVCQCDDNAEGMFPCNCDCSYTEKRDKILKMLRNVREEQIFTLNLHTTSLCEEIANKLLNNLGAELSRIPKSELINIICS